MKKVKRGLKNKKMEKQSKTGFMIYDFMVDRLCLTGVTLLVYALVYSFTVAGANCHGSIEYIGIRVGASGSSVKRALNLLLSRGLIIKRSDSKMRTKIYVADLSATLCYDSELSQIDLPGTDRVTESDLAASGFNLGYNNKEIIKTTTSSAGKSESEDFYFEFFGSEKLIMLTYKQYIDLKNRLGKETLEHYIARLESTLLFRPGIYVKSHYKTILKWAREDARVE